MAGLVIVSVAITAGTIVLSRTKWEVRYETAGWSTSETIIFAAGWASVGLLLGVGLVLWWRRPMNATGRWLWIAGASLGVWFVGTYWDNPGGYVAQYALFLFRPALAMAFLGWPTGRPARAITRWIIAVGALYAALTLALSVLAESDPDPRWADDPIGRFDIGWLQMAITPITSWTLLFVPAVVVVVLLVRQQRSAAAGARGVLAPLTIAGVLTFGTDIVMLVIATLGADLLYDDVNLRSTTLGVIILTENYAQGVAAAIGVAIATVVRRRSARTERGQRLVELAMSPAAHSPTTAVRVLLGDPTARLLYRAGDGSLVDALGSAAEEAPIERHRATVRDDDGEEMYVLDCDASVAAHPTLLDVAIGTIAHDIQHERAVAIAQARRAELVAVQHTVLDATDAARRRLERDLHDSAQQRLVGLALAARLLARDASGGRADEFRRELSETRLELGSILDDAEPAVLAGGLVAALHTLAATAPVDVDVLTHGDVDASDPQARALWFIANEIVANSVKHAAARRISITLSRVERGVTLTVRDDGCGGVETVPVAIARRTADAGGASRVDSPLGRGTAITVSMPLAAVEVLA